MACPGLRGRDPAAVVVPGPRGVVVGVIPANPDVPGRGAGMPKGCQRNCPVPRLDLDPARAGVSSASTVMAGTASRAMSRSPTAAASSSTGRNEHEPPWISSCQTQTRGWENRRITLSPSPSPLLL